MGDQDLNPSNALDLDPVAIEHMMSACRELAAEMDDLVAYARAELDRAGFGLGDNVDGLFSAKQLAQRIREIAVGVDGDTTGSAVGLFEAQSAYADQLEIQLNEALARYRTSDEETTDAVTGIE